MCYYKVSIATVNVNFSKKNGNFNCLATFSVISQIFFAMVGYTDLHIVPIVKFHVNVNVEKRFRM